MNKLKRTKAPESSTIPAELVPVWFQLPLSFYKSLQAISQEVGISSAEVLNKGMRMVLREHRLGNSEQSVPKDLAAQKLVSHRWANVSAEQRSQAAREMSQRRWAKQRSDKVDES